VKYNQKIFSGEDQVRLREFIDQLNDIGAYFILTNAAHESINDLFSSVGSKHEVNRYSVIGGKGASRVEINEYLFTNIGS
jgi:DNA adenine methylase